MPCNAKFLSTTQIRKLIGLLKSRQYLIYEKPYQLNIVGVRNRNTNPTQFDDKLNVFWKGGDLRWVGRQYKITTDPSTTYLKKGGIGRYEGKSASAILPNGQYIDSWKIGSHRGNYTALVQAKELCVYRDYDRNAVLSFDVNAKHCGNFGINIHRGKSGGADDGKGNTKDIGMYSAGCQVFQNSYCFEEFMKLVKKQKEKYGNKYFTYTLFDKWLTRQFFIKRFIYIGGITIGLGLIGYGYYKVFKNK